MRPRRIIVLLAAVCGLLAQTGNGNPEERAQMFKTLILQRLVQEGWQLTQESHSQLVFEKPAQLWMSALVRTLETGAGGTNGVYRLSVTFTPGSDHITNVVGYETLNSQNAFGQVKSFPITNKKERDWWNEVLTSTAARLPSRYKSARRQ